MLAYSLLKLTLETARTFYTINRRRRKIYVRKAFWAVRLPERWELNVENRSFYPLSPEPNQRLGRRNFLAGVASAAGGPAESGGEKQRRNLADRTVADAGCLVFRAAGLW